MPPFLLTRPRLLADLYAAYELAARHKQKSACVVRFAARLDDNLNQLADELISRSYRPRPATCFVISDPKKREVFAADFADRVVHHLYFAYAGPIFERTFIADSYSCIVGCGTHYGIARLAGHIRSESRNDTRPAFALKLDIRGYFMHIRRQLLADMVVDTLRRMSSHKVCRRLATTWTECVDIDFLAYLTRVIVLTDPTVGCLRRGKPSDWDGLPESKSLFCSPPGCGLPIGNLTSQLFSNVLIKREQSKLVCSAEHEKRRVKPNVYLGRFDDFMKREMLCRHYGRYVDDAFVVSSDRDYVSSESLRRMTRHLIALNEEAARGEASPERLRSALSSYGGVMGHYASFNVRNALFSSLPEIWRDGEFDERLLKWAPYSPQV
ncbi:MAG: hypothetical protein ACI35Q_10595 [Marinilabiliaceae bacterium]